MKFTAFVCFLLCFTQISLLEAQSLDPSQYVYQTFRGTRVVNGHSVETLKEGELDFLISHRMGRINGGLYEFFGLDQATIRLGLDYGVQNWVNIGLGRSSFGKHLDAYLKLKLLRQKEQSIPLTITGFSSAAMNTLKAADQTSTTPIQTRLAFTHQLLLARKFSDRLSVQLSPTLVHYNLVEDITEKNDVFAIGGAVRIQLTKNIAMIGEYFYKLPNQLKPEKLDPIAIGFDINTGSHVFQLHFTNAQSMIEKAFIGETTGDFGKGDIHFGFNMSRTFKVKGRRY